MCCLSLVPSRAPHLQLSLVAGAKVARAELDCQLDLTRGSEHDTVGKYCRYLLMVELPIGAKRRVANVDHLVEDGLVVAIVVL